MDGQVGRRCSSRAPLRLNNLGYPQARYKPGYPQERVPTWRNRRARKNLGDMDTTSRHGQPDSARPATAVTTGPTSSPPTGASGPTAEDLDDAGRSVSRARLGSQLPLFEIVTRNQPLGHPVGSARNNVPIS